MGKMMIYNFQSHIIMGSISRLLIFNFMLFNYVIQQLLGVLKLLALEFIFNVLFKFFHRIIMFHRIIQLLIR